MRAALVAIALLIAAPAAAQESPGYRLDEHLLNSGGSPEGGAVLSSASFRITLDSIGEGLAGPGMSGVSFRLDGGFVPRYAPPGEVTTLVFTNATTLSWSPERSAGRYNLYRDLMSDLAALGYGDCAQHDLNATAATDLDTVPLGDGYFYLVTAENRLDEEGPKGFDSQGQERPNAAPCP